MKTFPIGGVHPHDYKITAGKAIEIAPLPKVATIFMSQHLGAPATPIVKKGDIVKVGQLIGEPAGFISAPVHSSVSGTVTAVANVIDGGGIGKMAVTIAVEGDEWVDTIDRSEELVSECELEPKDIIAKVKEAGIVGLGGATFPTSVKLSPPPGKSAEFLIINGVECEPFLTADHRLMLEKADEFLVGCKVVMKALGVTKCYVGIENNKPDAISFLQSKADGGIEIVPLKVQYPQGGEKQLIAAVTGREVPSGALPIEVGAVVQNVGTIVAIYQAVQKNMPLFQRITTVTGEQVPEPKNVLVRVGTPISDLIALCGGDPEADGKAINGGPMMGRAMRNTAAPTTKGCSGVLLMPVEKSVRPVESPCISCGKCVSACPMGLEPHLLAKIFKFRVFDRSVDAGAQDCIECGCCTFSCPASIPLVDYIRQTKAEAMKIIRGQKK